LQIRVIVYTMPATVIETIKPRGSRLVAFLLGELMNAERLYSKLTIKAVDEDKRIIKGWATTPEPDRVGDIVEPMGAVFPDKVPLLWMHQHDLPVGTVKFGKPTSKGIPFEAKLPIIPEPAQLRARIDEAWQSVKAGIVSNVSIGFRPMEYSIIEETGGLRFTRIEIYELSLVSVPANAGATITEIKSIDRTIIAATGKNVVKLEGLVTTERDRSKTVKLQTKVNEMSIKEKLEDFKKALDDKRKKLVELAKKSADAGESFDASEQEEFDTLQGDIGALEKHIERLEIADKADVASAVKTATPVPTKNTEDAAAAARSRQHAQVKAAKKDAPGVNFARVARCKALARLDHVPAYELARLHYGEDSEVYGHLKAAVAAGTTAQATWAAPLVGDETTVFADFVEYLRPMTILGRMGQGGIPGATRIPFRTRLITQTTGGEGYWVGEGNAKPLTKFDFTGTTLDPLKVANIAVITMELLRDSSPSAEAIVRDQLAAALAARLDIDFVDPAKVAVSGVSPASITNGVTPIASSGDDADAVRCDLQALLQSYADANNPPTTGVIIMSASKAIALMSMRNALGAREFPDMNMGGGFLEGFPVITSQYLSGFADTAGEYVFMINASDIWFADEGGVSVDMSDQASLQFDSAPDNPTTASTVMVSLWQRNLVAFRAERTINWAKRRSTAVAVLSGVNWTACAA
jgi:HK97 family phage major capsid protein/HK97 family phage prohead protease